MVLTLAILFSCSEQPLIQSRTFAASTQRFDWIGGHVHDTY
jgi:hypothetical protein